MVNLHDPIVTPQIGSTFSRLWHILAGIYFWEFFTTLDYEWRIIRGNLPYRWTIWIYFFARVAGLLGVVLTTVGLDLTAHINCQVWISTVAIAFYLSLGAASYLIVLRIIAIWNGNKVAMATVISLWVIGIGFHIQAAARFRSTWDPAQHGCLSVTTNAGILNILPTIFVDLALYLIMLVGLVLLHRRGSGSFGVTPLVLKQGVIWILLVFLSEGPQAVVATLSSNDQFIEMLLTPGLVMMIIASTRMHRFLIEFAASGSPDVTLGDFQLGGASSTKPKPRQTALISPNRIEVSVHTAFERHSPTQINDHGSCESATEKVHEKPSAWSLGDDVERGMQKQVSVLETASQGSSVIAP